MNEDPQSLSELISLAQAIDRQEAINEANISSFFECLERLLRDEIRLTEPVWVGISDDSPSIFGWSEVESNWHIAVGARETCPDPDSGETIIYGSSQKKILQCDKGIQRQVFCKAQLLIAEIHRYLKKRHEESRKTQDEIVEQVESIQELLKTVVGRM